MVSPYRRLKRQRFLTLVFFFSLMITATTLYLGYLKKPKPAIPEISPLPEKKIEMSFNIFQSPVFQELILPQRIESAKEEEIKRENPFLPY